MSDSHKIFLLSTIAALLLLVIAIADTGMGQALGGGYFTFLRIVTCAVLVWHCVLLRSPWWRFLLGAGAILYNPIIPIHLGDRDAWCFFNVITALALLAACFFYRHQLKTEAHFNRSGKMGNR